MAGMATTPRSLSTWSKAQESGYTPDDLTPETRSEVLTNDKGEARYGRIIGGKHLEGLEEIDLHNDHGPLKKLDIDIPLTLTELVHMHDKDYIVLSFAKGDKENPFNWNPWRKRTITTMLNLMTLFIGLATTAYSSGINSMVADLGTTTEIGQLGLFLFNFVCALAPLFLAPFCELVGRKVIYVGAYFCFTLIFIGLALGKNIATILVMRAFLGLFGCVGTILVGGTFDDMYEPRDRGQPMAMFTFVAIFGTVAAPIYAGFIDETIGWRWIEGIQGLANIPLLLAVAIFFKESRGGVYLHKRAKKLRQATGDDRYCGLDDIETPGLKQMLKRSSVKAIQMLFSEPVVFAFGLWIGFTWFIVFLFLSVIPITYSQKKSWGEGVAGLPYIALCLGTFMAYLAHQFQMRKYDKLMADPERKPTPESRLYGAMFGAIWLPVGLFIYSFTQYGYLPWIAPTIALVPIAFGIFFVFESTYSYTADCYGTDSSSAIAGQGFLRNTLGAVSPLFASQFFHGVGSQYAGLILSLVAVFLCMIPYVAYNFGGELRKRSKKARDF